jgi:hypothetical protein
MEKEDKPQKIQGFSPNAEPTSEKSPSRIVWRVLILAGVLIVLVVLSIGIIKLVPKALSSLASVNVSFSSLFSPKEKIAVSSDKSQITSGDSFTISFNHTGGKVDGYFNLSTACQNSYQLFYQNGGTRRSIDCKNPLSINASSTAVTLYATNNTSSAVTMPITLDFVSKTDGKIQASGETTVVVNPASSGAVSPVKNTSTSTYNGGNTNNGNTGTGGGYTYPPATSNGTADLVARITFVGIQDRNSGNFIATTNVNSNDRVIVRFEVQNIGAGASGPWDLRTVLPTNLAGDQTKYLYNQPSIPAGLAVSGTLYFDNPQYGQNQLIQIVVDPNSRLNELRKDNNVAEVSINTSGNGSYNGGGTTSNGVDLTVRILDVNPLDNESAEIRFQITNQGSQSSGSWDYRMEIPEADIISNNYNQPSMAPGESRIFTARFDGLNRRDNNTIEITVDPRNRISETNESNNFDSQDINL